VKNRCPENIAKKGNYGSFLLRQNELVVGIIQNLSKNLIVPVTCKIRLLDMKSADSNQRGLQGTINLCKELDAAGVSLICVHGRTRNQKGFLTGNADWNSIKLINSYFKSNTGGGVSGGRFPIMANGGCETRHDIDQCLKFTGVDAVMSAEALLEVPTLFNHGSHNSFDYRFTNKFTSILSTSDNNASSNGSCSGGGGGGGGGDSLHMGHMNNNTATSLALEYLEFAEKYPPSDFFKCVKAHCMKLAHRPMVIAKRFTHDDANTSPSSSNNDDDGDGDFGTDRRKTEAFQARDKVFNSQNEVELREGLLLLDSFMHEFYHHHRHDDESSNENTLSSHARRSEQQCLYHSYSNQDDKQDINKLSNEGGGGEGGEGGEEGGQIECNCWRRDTWYRRHRQNVKKSKNGDDEVEVEVVVDNAAVERKRRIDRKENRRLHYRAMGFKV
jgi:tRNA-dihydrouridine synthase